MAIGRQTKSDISFAELQRFFGLGLTWVAVSNADATPHGLAARSLASVGLGALIGLPLLLLASVALGAPLAGPAAISLGYLATARALVERHMRSAMFWSVAVVLALVAWAALAPLVGGVLVVIGPGSATRSSVRAISQQLDRAGVPVIGVALNCFEADSRQTYAY